MQPTAKHLEKAQELLKEEAKLARYEWEDALEASKTAQREEQAARDKFLAFKATVHLLDGAYPTDTGGDRAGTAEDCGAAEGRADQGTYC